MFSPFHSPSLYSHGQAHYMNSVRLRRYTRPILLKESMIHLTCELLRQVSLVSFGWKGGESLFLFFFRLKRVVLVSGSIDTDPLCIAEYYYVLEYSTNAFESTRRVNSSCSKSNRRRTKFPNPLLFSFFIYYIQLDFFS